MGGSGPPLATPLPVQAHGGRSLHLHARFNWPVWTSLAEAVHQAPTGAPDATQAPAPAAAAPADLPRGVPEPGAGSGLAALCTGDEQVAKVIDKLRRVLDRDIPVLILGETGTGKTWLARAIHADSARAHQAFVTVNCAALPDTSLEVELFGCEDGAFNGSRRRSQVGKIMQANGGTLFLNAIGELPIALQARLLRVLQERRLTPLGSSQSVAVDLSVVCATRRNLREMVDTEQFHEGLFYRLNGLAVRLPALRERSDLAALVQQILERENPGHSVQLSPELVPVFRHCLWPGNLRQLFNVLRTASVMAAGEPMITSAHLSDDFLEDARSRPPMLDAATATPPPAPGHATRSLQALEIEAMREALDSAGGNLAEAARRLGVSRNTLYRKLRWNLQPPAKLR